MEILPSLHEEHDFPMFFTKQNIARYFSFIKSGNPVKYSQPSLNGHLYKPDLVLVPPIFQSFYCN